MNRAQGIRSESARNNTNMKLKDLNEAQPSLPAKPDEDPVPAIKRKPYRKPALKRLGMLKSVAGSGIAW